MRVSPTPPEVKPNGWYTIAESARHLGMSRTSFWRVVNAGYLKRRLSRIDNKFRIQGIELMKFYNTQIKPY